MFSCRLWLVKEDRARRMERAALLFYRGCSKGEKETKGGAAAAFACSRPPPPPPPPPPPAPAANLAKRRWLSQKGEENDFFSPFSQPVAACFSFTLPLKQNVDAIVPFCLEPQDENARKGLETADAGPLQFKQRERQTGNEREREKISPLIEFTPPSTFGISLSFSFNTHR